MKSLIIEIWVQGRFSNLVRTNPLSVSNTFEIMNDVFLTYKKKINASDSEPLTKTCTGYAFTLAVDNRSVSLLITSGIVAKWIYEHLRRRYIEEFRINGTSVDLEMDPIMCELLDGLRAGSEYQDLTFLDLPDDVRVKILNQHREAMIHLMRTALQDAEKLEHYVMNKVQRIEDKIAHILPVVLLVPALMFSPLFSDFTRIALISLLPGFSVSVIYAFVGLWPYPTPSGHAASVPPDFSSEKADKNIDFYYISRIMVTHLKWFAHYEVLSKKSQALKTTFVFTFVNICLLLLTVLLLDVVTSRFVEVLEQIELTNLVFGLSILFLFNIVVSALLLQRFRTPQAVHFELKDDDIAKKR